MRLKPTKGQRWRVSVFPPGVRSLVPTNYPLVHKASKDQETAQKHYDFFKKQIGNGKVGRVIMHQGKLYLGNSQYIHNDTKWWEDLMNRTDKTNGTEGTNGTNGAEVMTMDDLTK